ncbi:MAG TPA: pyruvate dehydrogenase (acetyl-transferring), homodimeric type, partial [Paracoccaceae bacterium]|nr:pyruvate dehydrogenase (acetyl-transferring), homodimeric type [Paracoccaceae bacterium]
ITSDLWVATSLNELAREAQDVVRENRMNPVAEAKVPYVTRTLSEANGPVIAATDYMKNFVEQIRGFVPQPLHVLGTDGFGRSDSRARLRRHFEVDANHIAATAVYALFQEGKVEADVVRQAYRKYEIDPGKVNPRTA